ncbi:ABC transporter ATP-binding protein [Halorhabdus amylolytica]|uniref:ABC transporter ATP-binding protein n=1 Tax=Halorhabdus amylolytica TaxID=2559573 RepID=UPI0031F53B34
MAQTTQPPEDDTGGSTDPGPAVRMENITKRFPGVVANDQVTLEVERGSVHTLLGENGAGKSTLMNVLYGLYQQEEGTVYLDGQEINFETPQDAIDAGIGMIHQHFMLVDTMTVAENVTLGNEPRKWNGLAYDAKSARDAVRELSERYNFDLDPTERIEDISVGEKQRVEILKTLYRGADVLIFDEPTAVLTPQEVDELFRIVDELTEQGKTLIFITHKLGEAMEISDDITVLRDGENVGTVDPGTATRESLAELMVGREVMLEVEKDERPAGDPALSISELVVENDEGVRQVDEVDLTVHEGEILGIAGVDGNGQSQLVDSVVGLDVPDEGTVELDGEDMTRASRREHIMSGMSFVPEDRQARGLVMDFDLVENALLGNQYDPDFTNGPRVDWGATRDHAEKIIDRYDVRTPGVETASESLSGGNQQKVIVGREILRDPDVIVASHPTRGVDVGSIEFIHDQLVELRDEGKGVLLVSSKLDEVQQLSDRLAVIYEGEIMDIVDPAEVTDRDVGLLMAGEMPDEYGGGDE